MSPEPSSTAVSDGAPTATSVTAPDSGAIPILFMQAPEEAQRKPALLCVPSIFGANPDLIEQMRSLTDVASVAIMDPFWRVEPGAIPYSDRQAAFDRAGALDRSTTAGDVAAVASWLAGVGNGKVAGLGICFGGPAVLVAMSAGRLQGVATWHGSRMERVLDQLDLTTMTGPIRMHFGDADPITPPDVIDAIESFLGQHNDCAVAVHPGAEHGFSHEGDAWDPVAAEAALSDVRAVLTQLHG